MDFSRLLRPWDSPDKNTGVGYHFLLLGIFLTQGANPHVLSLLHWQAGSLPLSSASWEALPGSSLSQDLPAVQETQVRSLGGEDPLEKEMATHSSILAWKIPWTESLGSYSP